MRRGEIDVPKVGARVKDVNRIEEVVRRVLVDLGDHAGAGFFPVVAIEVAAEMELLAHREFFGEAKNTAVAAYEQGFNVLRESVTRRRDPRCLNRHAESHAVTLPESVRFCGHGAINKGPAIRLARRKGQAGERNSGLSFQVITRWRKAARWARPAMLSLWRAARLGGLPGRGIWCKLKSAVLSLGKQEPFATLRKRL